MPRYFYNCQNCKKKFELNHSVDLIIRDCPLCNCADKLERIVNTDFTFNAAKKLEEMESLRQQRDPKKNIDEHITKTRRELEKDRQELEQQRLEFE